MILEPDSDEPVKGSSWDVVVVGGCNGSEDGAGDNIAYPHNEYSSRQDIKDNKKRRLSNIYWGKERRG